MQSAVHWFHHHEVRLCRAANAQASERVVAIMRWASLIGDGPAWFSIAVVLELTRRDGAGLRMIGALCVGAILCRLIKLGTGRDRPFAAYPDIRRLAAPLDRYSFPSGHTLHAAMSAAVVTQVFPWSAPLAWPIAMLIGASRVVLGFHYPTDVVAGAVLGVTIGRLAFAL